MTFCKCAGLPPFPVLTLLSGQTLPQLLSFTDTLPEKALSPPSLGVLAPEIGRLVDESQGRYQVSSATSMFLSVSRGEWYLRAQYKSGSCQRRKAALNNSI